MRISISAVISFLVMVNLSAQQEYQLSQYMFDFISINPGAAGSKDGVCLNGIFRNQWTGIEGAPEDVIFNGDVPFRLLKKDHGVGLAVFREKIGFYEDIDLKLDYSYRATVGDGKLGFGIGVNFLNRGIKPNWYIPDNANYYSQPEGDPAIPQEDEKVWAIDLNAGLFYSTEDLYLGISSTHINQASYKFHKSNNDEVPDKINRNYYIISGYTIQLSNPSFEVVPSILIQSTGKIHKFDLNTVLVYNKKIWGGVTYRPGAAVVGMLGFEILNGAKIGFAYDFSTTSITNYDKSSYEVLINYCFKIGVDRTPQKYKSIRFL